LTGRIRRREIAGMTNLTVRELLPSELARAAAVLGRGMRDNPLHIAALGRNPARRVKAFTGIFTGVLERVHRHGIVLGAFEGRTMVGVCAYLPPGKCQPSFGEKVKLLWGVVRHAGLFTTPKALRWLGTWAKLDPKVPHWHLGPIAVDQGRQGLGIGGALLREFCARVDLDLEAAYLETDRNINVVIYQHFGFSTVRTTPVLGVPNWFMFRPAQAVKAVIPHLRRAVEEPAPAGAAALQ
jgi:ribosomal protein S18 acetylase RimI-like enzyme